jgi:hypothetical protein
MRGFHPRNAPAPSKTHTPGPRQRPTPPPASKAPAHTQGCSLRRRITPRLLPASALPQTTRSNAERLTPPLSPAPPPRALVLEPHPPASVFPPPAGH